VKITVLYVGSSLLAPLRKAERDINQQYRLGLRVMPHSCTLPLSDPQWIAVEQDMAEADIVFVLHVTDSENAARITSSLDRHRDRHHAVIVINCLGELMRRTRLGDQEFAAWFDHTVAVKPGRALDVLRRVMSWMGRARSHGQAKGSSQQYLGLIARLPAFLRFVPPTGKLRPIKHYLTLFCYFLQPTARNIRSMLLYAIKNYIPGCDRRIRTAAPQQAPATGIYHPEAESLFDSFESYRRWYDHHVNGTCGLDPERTIGLLLLRPQVVSEACRHYDAVIRALQAEGLGVLPVLSTFMDNREACQEFFLDPSRHSPRVSQVLSLTGFSFVGGPAMNDSRSAITFLTALNRPLRSAVSLETQTIEHWAASLIGLNPVQVAMQIAIPEIDGATEPFVFGGLREGGDEPEPLEDRCHRIARRVARWNRLRLLPRSEVRLAVLIYCFPPDKGNLGTAAGLDVFPSLLTVLRHLSAEGYTTDVPSTSDALRNLLLSGDSGTGDLLRVAYRLPAEEYFRLCPYVQEIEAVWGPVPGRINSQGLDILIHGVHLGNIFVGVQPTFGYEGDPMRLLMDKSASPHHGFMGLYTYLDQVFHADAVVHVGTHGALEFMPGKQAGLSGGCWPDRLIGDLPNIYLYSVNNPSEGTIARRRSAAELVSYLTPPLDEAGLYKDLSHLKELIGIYRECRDETLKTQLFSDIRQAAGALHLDDSVCRD
jgi:magnesium chelatase subunit H